MKNNRDREEILQRIKSNYSKTGNKRRSLSLSSKQDYRIVNNDVEIHLSAAGLCLNMQSHESAFEGWALVLKVWGKFDQVTLCWEKPEMIENGHYQRFLFRVQQFLLMNNSWFSICYSSKPYIEDLKIKTTGNYTLNSPLSNRDSTDAHRPEAKLEIDFSTLNANLHNNLSTLVNANFIHRQLPVGLFEGDKVKDIDSIFTGKKSAIDLWGINESNELLIFELKAKGNDSIGIISELFFYVCLMQGIIYGIFSHYQTKDDDLMKIPNVKGIKAYFLAFDLHPLVDKSIIDELNKMIPNQVEYHFIRINDDRTLKFEF